MSAMKIWYTLGFPIPAMMIAFAQQSLVPYADGDGPTFAGHTETNTWPGSYRSIRKVDFRNLRLQNLLGSAGPIPLRNGHYEHNEPDEHSTLDLDSVRYLTPPSRTSEGFALVIYSWFDAAVSSSSGDYAVLFKVSNGRLQSVQSISWSTHNAGLRPTWSFDPKTNKLVIRSDHYRPGDAHCCISAVDVVTYHWNGTQFDRTGITTELLRRPSLNN
jgi:hypothetical protein